MAEPEYSAAAFNSVVRSIRELASADSLRETLAALPADTRELVDHPPLAIAWISYRHSFALVRAAHDHAFERDDARTMQVAQRSVIRDMATIHRMFIRLATVEYVVGRAAKLWDSYWRNNGSVTLERVDARRLVVRYQGVQHATRLFWIMQCGVMRGLAEATGMKDAAVTIEEGHVHPSRCAILISW